MAHQTWQLDQTHSSIGFTIRHMVIAKVHGRFARYEGTLTLPEGDLAAGAVEVKIAADSIDTQVEGRDNHLRSPDFFDVAAYPELTFRSTRLERTGQDQFRVVGDLTIRGVTREVALDAEFLGRMTDPFGAERVAFTATGSIDRKDFGLTWNKAIETGGVLVGDRVDFQLEVQAVKAAAQAADRAA